MEHTSQQEDSTEIEGSKKETCKEKDIEKQVGREKERERPMLNEP